MAEKTTKTPYIFFTILIVVAAFGVWALWQSAVAGEAIRIAGKTLRGLPAGEICTQHKQCASQNCVSAGRDQPKVCKGGTAQKAGVTITQPIVKGTVNRGGKCVTDASCKKGLGLVCSGGKCLLPPQTRGAGCISGEECRTRNCQDGMCLATNIGGGRRCLANTECASGSCEDGLCG